MKERATLVLAGSLSKAQRVMICAIVLALLLVFLTPSSSQLAVPTPHLGYAAFLGERTQTHLVADMDFDWVVWLVQWELFEPTEGTYLWGGLNDLLDGAQSRDLHVVLRVTSAPVWARRNPADPFSPPADMNDLGTFMGALASYAESYDAGRVAGYVIWNEPNLPMNWGGSPSAAEYVTMLAAVWGPIKAANADAAVVTAGMATIGGGGGGGCLSTSDITGMEVTPYTQRLLADGVVNDLDFICGMYQSGGQPHFDVLGSHPYGFAYEPEQDPTSVGGLAFRRVEQQRAVMVSQGDEDKQIWAIEFGWILDPGSGCYGQYDWGDRWWQRVSEHTQAQYLWRAYWYAREAWPWMGVMSFFNVDFATLYWYDYCDPMRWYSITYRANHKDPGNSPILFREAYYTLKNMPREPLPPRAYLPLVMRNH